MQVKNGQAETWLDGALNHDGSVAGSYLHGLFDQNLFTRSLLNQLRQNKGLAPLDDENFDYTRHKETQFDALASNMRVHLDIDRIYALMRQHQEPQH